MIQLHVSIEVVGMLLDDVVAGEPSEVVPVANLVLHVGWSFGLQSPDTEPHLSGRQVVRLQPFNHLQPLRPVSAEPASRYCRS